MSTTSPTRAMRSRRKPRSPSVDKRLAVEALRGGDRQRARRTDGSGSRASETADLEWSQVEFGRSDEPPQPLREIALSYAVDHSTISRLKARHAAEFD